MKSFHLQQEENCAELAAALYAGTFVEGLLIVSESLILLLCNRCILY